MNQMNTRITPEVTESTAPIEVVRVTGSKGRAQDKTVEVVEVLEGNKYHVKNTNPPHDSFIVEAREIKDE